MSSVHPAPDDDEQPAPWTRPGFIVAGAFLAILVLLAIVIVSTSGGDSNDSNKAAAPSETPAPHTSGAGDSEDCPHLSASDQSIPNSTPHGVTWSIADTMAVPSSHSAGPARVHGDVARCYAHTPTGALMAAGQISARYVWAADWKTVTEKQTTGQGRARYMHAREKVEATAGPLTPEADRHGQLAGFRFVTYASDTAVINMVHQFKDGSLVVTPMTLHWMGGDWKLDIASSPAPQTTVQSLDGYIQFGGV